LISRFVWLWFDFPEIDKDLVNSKVLAKILTSRISRKTPKVRNH
jgi:hypothetical protein